VAVKAARGGGGRGFRVVRGPEEASEAFEAAAREAQFAFGSPKLYLERYLETPRHIEVQIIGDCHGNLIHLGERECSLQRRHQKLVEESPSPVVDGDLRARMGAAALKVARAAGYQSAGTVEFLLEETEEGPRFWFLELNSRLQVEHPVTEGVIGCDLVKEMVRVAEGARLSLTQDDVVLRGHAIECRINAENPAQGFLPSPGTIGAYREPAGPGIRVDSGVTAGSQVPEVYDSLIAKLIVTGADRDEAIRRMLRALDEFQIEDVHTTIPFHRHVVGSEWFAQGRFSTKTVERLDLSRLPLPTGRRAPGRYRESARIPGAHRQEREITVELGGKRFDVRFTERLGGRSGQLKPKPPEPGRRTTRGTGDEVIIAPMQGTIVKTLRAEGDQVEQGDPILVLEAMKMENLILSPREGWIKALLVKPGDSVERGASLAEIGFPEP
jgi:acetyl-CoA/propionyl-CoA carboxylase biotin carboxyl carrier protein